MNKEVDEERTPRTVADVKEMLTKHSNGEIQRTIQNCITILQNDHVLADAIRLNLLSERIDIVKPVGWPRSGKTLNDIDMKYILRRMEKYGISSEKKIESAIHIVANENRYHPIRDYLNGLQWDGTERIAHVLHHFLGAAEDEYTCETMKIFLLGAIKRVFQPGCKFETMLCLVGGQGVGKSSFFRLLAVKDEWFSDDLRRLDDDNVYRKLQGHWMWGGGWLQSMGFHDFAGSAAVHNVGGVIALLGAAMLGPRIGKYDKDGNPHAIPGHNLTAGALGVFILWFCWFGFNGGSSLSLSTDATMTLTGLVCFNTNLAAAVATCVTMIFTWLRYGKPDVSMTLNGSLAGLVAITAGCDAVSPFGAFIIGFVAGVLVVLSVEFFDKIAKIDDPVGAVSVHFANGVWGTIAVGLFSNGGDGVGKGLFYGGGLSQLGIQLLGLITVDAYVLIVMFLIFKIIDKTIGLRVPAEVEIDGLDIHEHGLASAYAGFSISDANAAAMLPNENTDLGEDDPAKASSKQIDAAVPVVREPAVIHDGIYDTGMHKVSIIAKLSKFDQLKTALNDLGVTGMTVTQVMGCGIQKGTSEKYRGVPVDSTLLPKIKVEVIVSKISVDSVVEAAKKALYTGHIGDGKIFVYNVTRVVKIRTGEEDFAALQDVE